MTTLVQLSCLLCLCFLLTTCTTTFDAMDNAIKYNQYLFHRHGEPFNAWEWTDTEFYDTEFPCKNFSIGLPRSLVEGPLPFTVSQPPPTLGTAAENYVEDVADRFVVTQNWCMQRPRPGILARENTECETTTTTTTTTAVWALLQPYGKTTKIKA